MKKLLILIFVPFLSYSQSFEFSTNGKFNKNGTIDVREKSVESERGYRFSSDDSNAIESYLAFNDFKINSKNPDYILIYSYESSSYPHKHYTNFSGTIRDINGDVVLSFIQKFKKINQDTAFKRLAKDLANFVSKK